MFPVLKQNTERKREITDKIDIDTWHHLPHYYTIFVFFKIKYR